VADELAIGLGDQRAVGRPVGVCVQGFGECGDPPVVRERFGEQAPHCGPFVRTLRANDHAVQTPRSRHWCAFA
jgi:hypothetical protein